MLNYYPVDTRNIIMQFVESDARVSEREVRRLSNASYASGKSSKAFEALLMRGPQTNINNKRVEGKKSMFEPRDFNDWTTETTFSRCRRFCFASIKVFTVTFACLLLWKHPRIVALRCVCVVEMNVESPTALNFIGVYYKSAAIRLRQHQLKDKPQCSFNESSKNKTKKKIKMFKLVRIVWFLENIFAFEIGNKSEKFKWHS